MTPSHRPSGRLVWGALVRLLAAGVICGMQMACPTVGARPRAPVPSGGSGGGPHSAARPPSWLIPARIRRLANAEYDASVQALLSTRRSPASEPDFPPDLRRDGFTVNAAQRVDAVIVERLAAAADMLASEAKENGTLARLAPCAAAADRTRCARTFVTTFGARVYRRPLVEEEESALLSLYAVGAQGVSEAASYEEGIAHVTRGLLQSAGFLYVTELGNGEARADATVELTAHEIATSLAYLVTSAPPDAELVAKALSGALAASAERESQARRLFSKEPRAKDTVVRLVREWLGIDRIDTSAKDSLTYPGFEHEKARIAAESRDFVRAVAFESTGNVSELLGADWTVSSGPLALYRTAGDGPIPGSTRLADRVGILNQAAFLASYALAHESHPIFRGVAVAQRVTCMGLDSPASFNIQVIPPAPDPTATTRQRYDVHVRDAICAGCHDIIDPFGFSFEHYDGMGAHRALDHGKSVDSAVDVSVRRDFDGHYADSNHLAAALAGSTHVRECFTRFMFRAAVGAGDGAATPGEKEFIDAWRTTPAAMQGNIVETLISYVKGPGFTLRGSP
jgi:Protein of unknown function (DUF1592)/Protein of unknown function (DUF1588)/Protein of unknown function (DUF1595)/Protein of unknown function (DUF1587)